MQLVLLTAESKPESVLPALSLLPHQLRMGALELSTMIAEPVDAIIVDARSLLPTARSICRALVRLKPNTPVVPVLTEAGLVALPASWPLDEFLLTQSGAAEVEARLRLVLERKRCSVEKARADDASGPIVLDDRTYTARINGRPIAFTHTEFELVRYLLRHPDRVVTRARLLTDIWGYDYIGTSRTLDSHISRIRTKLGEHCALRICAVRNIGYRASLEPPKLHPHRLDAPNAFDDTAKGRLSARQN